MNVRSLQSHITLRELSSCLRADDKEKEKFEDLHRSISVCGLISKATPDSSVSKGEVGLDPDYVIRLATRS
jgi:hypothetical protein